MRIERLFQPLLRRIFRAPRHPGGIRSFPLQSRRRRSCHEVSSAGFWPGGGGLTSRYSIPILIKVPDGFAERPVAPPRPVSVFPRQVLLMCAEQHVSRGHFITLLRSTHTAAAETAKLDQPALERGIREVDA